MILTIENLCKTYGEKVLFNNVNFSLSDGDKVGIVGVNGTGKSTFIKVIAGIVPKDSGTITTGKNTKISYLEQDKVFEPEHTVLMEVY